MTPQEQWSEIINQSVENCSPTLSNHLQNLSAYDNVPRKEKAFRNFSANSLNLRGASGDAIITSIWKHLSSIREENMKNQEKQKQANVAELKEKTELKESPVKIEENVKGDNVSKDSSSKATKKSTKKVVKTIRKALKKAPSKQLKMKELRELVKMKLRDELTDMSKDDLKKTIKEAIAGESSILLDGKSVRLSL